MNTRPLVISNQYNYFIKGLVDAEASMLEEVNVLVYHNNLAELSGYLRSLKYFEWVHLFTKSRRINLRNTPGNVRVHIVSTTYIVPDGRNKRLGSILAKKIEKYIRENRIEFNLLHAHFTWPCGFVGVKLKEKYNVPLIVTGHGFDVYELPFRSSEWKKLIRHVLNSADYILTPSYSNLEYIKKLDVNAKVKVLPNGFDANNFFPRNKEEMRKLLKLPLDKKIILNVANLVSIKGQRHLIDAAARMMRIKEDLLCLIIGQGELIGDLQKQIEKLKLDDKVKLVGYKTHEEIPYWMNACDVFVLPSLSEGNPTVMFEALGCGKPFVGTKVGGIPEIITSEDYGFLCEPANPEDLAEKILKALEKKWDTDKIRQYAEQFTWENIAKKVTGIYNNLLG